VPGLPDSVLPRPGNILLVQIAATAAGKRGGQAGFANAIRKRERGSGGFGLARQGTNALRNHARPENRTPAKRNQTSRSTVIRGSDHRRLWWCLDRIRWDRRSNAARSPAWRGPNSGLPAAPIRLYRAGKTDPSFVITSTPGSRMGWNSKGFMKTRTAASTASYAPEALPAHRSRRRVAERRLVQHEGRGAPRRCRAAR
jgi:hypothetical protein